MNTSPIRQPAFCLLCIVALSSAVAARQNNPVRTLVIEKIESRYVAERTACQKLASVEQRTCRAAAELRYDVALAELKRLGTERPNGAPTTDPQAPPTAQVALGSSRSSS